MASPSRLTCIVPTVGHSPHLQQCLTALLTAGSAEIVLAVERGTDLSSEQIPDSIRVIAVPEQAGFTGACNRALEDTQGEFVALVNDDAVVEPGWEAALMAALEESPQIAAVQGVNLQIQNPGLIDGCGIAWNRRWQAIQIGHGLPVPRETAGEEIFGVSCTAAMFRRTALESVALASGEIFDPCLGSYYEDVDLACRLRAAGFQAKVVPRARARHAGAASSATNPSWRWRQIYRNRLLVLARLLGRGFLLRLPLFLVHDLLDVGSAAARLRFDQATGVVRGWFRASLLLPGYSHTGPPAVPLSQIRSFRWPGTRKEESA